MTTPKKKPVKKTAAKKKTPTKKKPAAKKKPSYSLEDIQGLAIEINEQLGMDPEIDSELDDVEELIESIKACAVNENGESEIYTTDEFSKEAFILMEKIGVEVVDPPEENGDEELEPEDEPEAKPEKKSAPKKKKKKAPPVKRYTRASAFAEALKEGETNINNLAERANELYVKNGGKDNLKESKWLNSQAISTLGELGLVTIESGELTLEFEF